MKIVFLGTSGSSPTKERSLSSVALEHEGEIFLFDCGEGTQRQMMINSLSISKVRAIFLSHIHGDHTLGLAGLMRTLGLNRRTAPLQIFIPKPHIAGIKALMGFDGAKMPYPVTITGIKSGIIYKGKGFTISAFKLEHELETYGFAFKEDDKLRFIKAKATKAGLKGAMFSEIQKKGSLSVSGRIIKLKDITTREAGRKVVYATDTRPTRSAVTAAAGADLLIHEATYASEWISLAKERKHSTSEEAATVAKKAGAKRLLLTHISARYKDTKVLLSDARKIFKNTEVATDGKVIEL
ncbi:MAG TPA: ribonuclease Z [Candidatus Baltobacteraceae bacterium]|nr:ribonuclease Z [Candidatus Baltobacteraceae bacterium]